MDPRELGYYERRPGSGVWYHPDKGQNNFAPSVCARPECGRELMGKRRPAQTYCSNTCSALVNAPERGARNSGPNNHQWRDIPSYDGRHKRVEAARGKASQFPCIDGCGNQAKHWSQRHGTDGLNPVDYDPRCVPCHKACDGILQGEAHGMATLTDAQARGIWASVGASIRELADAHGLSYHAVWAIRRSGRAWKHITGGRKADW